MSTGRIIIVIAILGLIGSFFYFDLGQFLTLDYVKSQQLELDKLVAEKPLEIAATFFLAYIAVTAASLPGAAILTLVAGAMFGVLWGTLLVSFASTIGATLAMLVARFILRGQVEARFGAQLSGIDKGIEKEGAFYLFTLRLVPLFPFFAINLLMGLTKIKVLTFFIVSQIGMLAGTFVYVNAGTQLAQIESTADILSLELLLSFALLGVFPLIAKKIVDVVREGKILRKWPKPKSFDQNVIVIGAGSGGLVAALIVATVKGQVTLIERDKMGGDCLNTGCVPSKSLIRSAKLAADMRRSTSLGFKTMKPEFEFADVMERVQRIVKEIEPHDSVERFESLGVNCEIGEAKILTPYSVEVNGKVITAKSIIVATGAKPLIPGIKNIESIDYLTSDNVWELKEQPKRLVVLGGGPIGTELSQAFHRLGSEVTQIEFFDRILVREDPEFSSLVMDSMKSEGVNTLTNQLATEVIVEAGEKFLRVEAQDTKESQLIPFDQLLVAVGRKANVSGFGLEELGVTLTEKGTVEVDEYLRTNYPNIYAIGDVAGPYQFTHTASHMAWYAAVNALFGTFKKFKVDYSVVPWATFTSPEVARVGLNELEARQQNIPYEIATYDVGELDRALADEEGHGLVKVLTVPGKDKILGVTIAADHAGDLISEYVLAMKHGLGLKKIMGTIHIYPTLAEMNKFAASEWAKQHKPEGLLNFSEKLHAWRRG